MADNTRLYYDPTWDQGNSVKSYEDGDGQHWYPGVFSWLVTPGDPDSLASPSPAALGDGDGNPTTLRFGSAAQLWTGSVWARAKGDADGHAQVDVLSCALPSGAASAANQQTVIAFLTSILSAVQGTLTVQESGAALTALQLIDDAVYTTGSGTTSKGVAIFGDDGANPRKIAVDGTGHLQVDVLSTSLPSGAATEAKQDTLIGHIDGVESALGDAVTALDVIDDWDESNRAKVNLIVGQAGVAGGAGAVGATTQRVTLASDDPGVALLTTIDADTSSLAGCVGGSEVQVDIVSAPTLTVATHHVTNAGTFAVQIDGSALTALQLLDDPVFADDAAFTPGTSKVFALGAQADETSTDSVDEGDIGCPRMTLDRKLVVTTKPVATGEGCDVARNIDVDETEDDVKTSAGMLYGYYFANLHASSVRYLKFYNATAANTTVGTTTPFLTLPLPAGSAGHIAFPHPVKFDAALCVAATTGVADNDTGAPGANEVVVNTFYK